MNRRVRASVSSPSGVRAGVWAGVRQLGTESEGGVFQETAVGCSIASFLTLLYSSSLDATAKPDCTAPGVRGRTGATPPFLPLVRQTGRGGVPGGVPEGVPPPPPLLGSLPSDLSLREGSEHKP